MFTHILALGLYMCVHSSFNSRHNALVQHAWRMQAECSSMVIAWKGSYIMCSIVFCMMAARIHYTANTRLCRWRPTPLHRHRPVLLFLSPVFYFLFSFPLVNQMNSFALGVTKHSPVFRLPLLAVVSSMQACLIFLWLLHWHICAW